MKYTSAQAAKLLSKLQQDYDRIALHETNACTFLASVGEDVEAARPAYDYEKTGEQLLALEAQIRRIKHAVNVFNTSTQVPGFDMTIDEMLVYLPQLSRRKAKLKEMADRMPRSRHDPDYARTTIIDYEYVNYDLDKVKADLDAVTEELSNAQLALDSVNHSSALEIEL